MESTDFDELVARGAIEFVSLHEQEYLKIAVMPEDLDRACSQEPGDRGREVEAEQMKIKTTKKKKMKSRLVFLLFNIFLPATSCRDGCPEIHKAPPRKER